MAESVRDIPEETRQYTLEELTLSPEERRHVESRGALMAAIDAAIPDLGNREVEECADRIMRDWLPAALEGCAVVQLPDLIELPKFQGCTDSNPDRCACSEPALVCEACGDEIVEGMQAYVITVKDAPWLGDRDSDQSWSNVWWHATCDLRASGSGVGEHHG